MTIASVILSQSPTLYWKLDDPNGPAASDSSGNSHPGVFLGQASLQQPGPEANTFSTLFGDAGGVKTLSGSPRRTTPFSMSCWVALVQGQVQHNVSMYNGLSNSNGAGLVWGTASAGSNPIQLLRGGIGFGGEFGAVGVGAWHHIAQTWSGTGQLDEYVDGVNVVSSPGVTFNAIGVNDWFIAGASQLTGQLLYMAHVALFSTQLTAAQISAQFGAPATLQSPPTVATTSDNNALLLQILAAVQRTFPTT